MKKFYPLSFVILTLLLFTNCGKNKVISYANLQGEWYSETCRTTIIFTSDSTLTMQSDGYEYLGEYTYILDPDGKIYLTYNESTSEHNIEIFNRNKIMIDGMGVMIGFDKGEHVFKRINS